MNNVDDEKMYLGGDADDKQEKAGDIDNVSAAPTVPTHPGYYQGNQNWGYPEYWDEFGECYILTREDKDDTPQLETTQRAATMGNDEWTHVGKGKKGQRGKHILNMGNGENNNDEYEWVKENAIVDSGTIDTVSALKHIEKGKLRPTAASKGGMNWTAANGGAVKNLGEGDINGKSDEGITIAMKTQVGDKISKMLISVGKMGEAGNMTIFNADMNAIRALAQREKIEENFIYNKKSGISSRINKEGGLYKYPIWIKRKKDAEMCGNLSHQCQPCNGDAIDDFF